MSAGYLWSLLVKDPLIILTTILMACLSVSLSLIDRQGSATDGVARAWARMLLFLSGIRLRVRGLENIKPGQSYIFAGNHLSLMDTPVMLSSVPVRFLFLVNRRYFEIPFLGTHLQRTGHFSIDPADVRGSLKVMTEAGRAIRKRSISILIFPEGSRSRGGMGEFKEGAAYMAIKSGVPVIPFAIRGTREVLEIGSLYVRGGPVDLAFGEPIDPTAYALKDRAHFNQLLRDTVACMAEDLSQDKRPSAPR